VEARPEPPRRCLSMLRVDRVSYRLALEGSLGTVVTLEPGSRRTVGLDPWRCRTVMVKPAAVSHRSLVLSDLRDSMLGMDDNTGGKSGRGRLGDDAYGTDNPG
jgi:hypothetical protein